MTDSSGNGFDGFISLGSEQYTDGQLGRCFDFTSDRVNVSHDPLLASTDLTVALWIKPTPFTGLFRDLHAKRSGGPGTFIGPILFQNSINNVLAAVSYDQPANSQCTNFTLTTEHFGRWIHVAYTINDTEIVIYIDGVRVASNTTGFTMGTNTTDVRIGHTNSTDPLDDVQQYNRVLTPAEIWELARKPIVHRDRLSIISETIQRSEVLQPVRSIVRSLSETINRSEFTNRAKGLVRTFTETFNISESTGIAKGRIAVINETINRVENVTSVIGSQLTKIINQTVNRAESLLNFISTIVATFVITTTTSKYIATTEVSNRKITTLIDL